MSSAFGCIIVAPRLGSASYVGCPVLPRAPNERQRQEPDRKHRKQGTGFYVVNHSFACRCVGVQDVDFMKYKGIRWAKPGIPNEEGFPSQNQQPENRGLSPRETKK